MKKFFTYPVMALFCLLFAVSCSQEEIVSNNPNGGLVSLSVNVPVSNPVTRAVPNIPTGYTLRCILQLVNSSGNEIIGHRYVEALASGQESIKFVFTAPAEAYKCLLWADYVKTPGSGDIADAVDNLYVTTNLKAIGYNLGGGTTHADMFNSDAADAFCGVIIDGSTSITLKRPLAKVTFASSEASYKVYDKIEVSNFPAPANFNVLDGTTGTSSKFTIAESSMINATTGVWFSAYLFVGIGDSSMGDGNDIIFKLKNASTDSGNLTIPGEAVTLTENYDIIANVTPVAGGSTELEVTFPGGLIDPNDVSLEIGDFINKDGSYSKNYDVDNAVAIVFALGAKGGDVLANYTGVTATGIAGYALAIGETNRAVGYKDGDNATTNTFPGNFEKVGTPGLDSWGNDYNGMIYTKKMMDTFGSYESKAFVTNFNSFKTDNAISEGSKIGISEWYIPSGHQLLDAFGLLLGCEGSDVVPAITKNDTFVAAYKKTGKGAYAYNGAAANIYSSTITAVAGSALAVQVKTTTAGSINLDDYSIVVANVKQASMASTAMLRPVITLFEK